MRYITLILFFVSLPCLCIADDDRDEINRILNAIEAGWEQADGEPFRKYFLDYDGARYVESENT